MPRYAFKRSLTLNEQKRIKEFEIMLWSIRFHDNLDFLVTNLMPGQDITALKGKINKLFALGSITRIEAYIYMTTTGTPAKVITKTLSKNSRWFENMDKSEIRTKYLIPFSTDQDIKIFEKLLDNYYEKYDMLSGHHSFKIDWPEDDTEGVNLFE